MKGISALRSTKSTKTAWKRENLRVQLSSAPSIEECGLDSSLYGEGLPFLTPRESIPPALRKTSSTVSTGPSDPLSPRTLSMPGLANEAPTSETETYVDEAEASSFSRSAETIEAVAASGKHHQSINNNFEANSSIPIPIPSRFGGGNGHVKRKAAVKVVSSHLGNGMIGSSNTKTSEAAVEEDTPLIVGGGGADGCVILNNSHFRDPSSSLRLRSSGLKKSSSSSVATIPHHHPKRSKNASTFDENGKPLATGVEGEYRPTWSEIDEEANVSEERHEQEEDDSLAGKSMAEIYSHLKSRGSISEIEEIIEEESEYVAVGGRGKSRSPSPTKSVASHHHRSGKELLSAPASVAAAAAGNTEAKEGKRSNKPPLGRSALSPRVPISRVDPSDSQAGGSASAEARRRWSRVRNTLTFARHMSSVRASASDFLEHTSPDTLSSDYHVRSDAGRAGAAAFEGARTRALGGPRARAKGRQGMEGMLVRQDKGIFTLVQDFYVACLKMPIAHFLVGVFLAPIALGLLFTPLYLFDKAGLAVDGDPLTGEVVTTGRVAAAKQKVSAVWNVFLYALSLSTTFGGSPVNATSPFCLIIANVNTLMGQFLFVFLSGAVFARMSQPSHPVRCSKKAIIRMDDFSSLPLDELKEKFRVFAVRLVLTGPPPCELVDARICLTFRIFIKLPSGSMFCTTQDLELVRPEVPYLRYGIMVRHIIDKRSPLYGHSMESLSDGDASFSLTISGQERTSMQPIFHLEDYFVCDGDVAWDSDYVDFIHINAEGQRVLDHSKIDEIHVSKETKFGCGGTPLLKGPEKDGTTSPRPVKGWSANALRGRKIWSSKSTSFTRADW